MQSKTYKNKLIVLLNLSASYKGGAQRRYLALFNYLQFIKRDDYFLVINDSLYSECFKDKILIDHKNVIIVKIHYGKRILSKTKGSGLVSRLINPTIIKIKAKVYSLLGKISSFLKQTWGWLGYSLQLMKIIKKYNISIIYGVFTGGGWSWQIARLLNIKFIYSYNDASASMIGSNILKILSTEYYALKFADKIDFLSEGVLKKLQEKRMSIKSNKVLISPNSFILYDNFYPVYPKTNRIVFSARLTSYKNPLLLLEAIAILKKKESTDFEMIFLGEGVLLNELINKKEQLKLNNVFFEGGVVDTAKYLRTSKLFISIQNDNNYPSQSLLEAMACENAIIASDVGETRKLVTENEGILVSLNAESIADAISYLINNPDECEKLGMNARKKVLTEQTIEKYVDYFFEITNC